MNLTLRSGRQIGEQEREVFKMFDKCYFCKGKVLQQNINIDYRWGETLVVIKNVPAGVCDQCGEKYLTSDVYKELEHLAKSKSHLMGKMSVDILVYETSSAA